MFPRLLRQEILILLAVKAALLASLYAMYFSPSHRVEVTPQRVLSHILEDAIG